MESFFYSTIGINLCLTATNIRDIAIQHVMHRHEYYEKTLPMRVIDFVVEEEILIKYPSIIPATGINQHTREIRLIYTEERTHYVISLDNSHPALQTYHYPSFINEFRKFTSWYLIFYSLIPSAL